MSQKSHADLKSSDEEKSTVRSHVFESTEQYAANGSSAALKRRLTSRQVTFIGFGSGIGTGLFIGTGASLANSGPLGLLLAFSIVGLALYATMNCIGEMATLIPQQGSLVHFSGRFIDRSVGLSLGISYFYCYAISVGSELSACAILVSFWSNITPALTITVGLVLILICNFASVNWYGDVEMISSTIKVLLFVLLIIVGLVIDLGGGPSGDRIGFRYWKEDGPFAPYPPTTGALSNFLAFVSALINASYSYIGIEAVVLAAAETANPTRVIPRAIRRVVYRILFFYVIGTLLVGMLVSRTNERLLAGTGNAASSPFVIAIEDAGIKVLPSIINAAILTSAWSAGNAYRYVASRTLIALASDGQAPKIFTRTNRFGVPYYAVGFSSLFSLFAYLSLGSGGAGQAFTWLLNLSTVAGLFAWSTMCLAYIRFHRACKVQGLDRNTLPFRTPFQPYLAYFGMIFTAIVIVFSGWSVFLKGNWSTSDFLASYIGEAIFFVPIIVYKIVYKTKIQRSKTIDLWSGRLDPEDEVVEPEPTTLWGRFLAWLF